MNLKIRRCFILFSIFLIISITPACAVKMGDVADEASKYNMESKQKKGFYAKIKFMAKGFKLIDKAKIAEKDSKIILKIVLMEMDTNPCGNRINYSKTTKKIIRLQKFESK